jgi:hypothetical protein
MHGRTIFRLVVALGLVVAIGAAGAWAYQAGLAAGIAHGGGTLTDPRVGYGWHPFGIGFGFFGFLGTILFLFLVFGLVRALVWGGRGPGWRGPGGWDADHDRAGWSSREERFEHWHRRLHETERGQSDQPPTGG